MILAYTDFMATGDMDSANEVIRIAQNLELEALLTIFLQLLPKVLKKIGNGGGNIGGGGDNKPTKVTSNLGNEIDITPSSNHTATTKNPGLKGMPNSSVDIIDSAGNIKTRRWFGSDGMQIRDVDFTNHGNVKLHPEWPHEHGVRW